jgi:hypothetical protein
LRWLGGDGHGECVTDDDDAVGVEAVDLAPLVAAHRDHVERLRAVAPMEVASGRVGGVDQGRSGTADASPSVSRRAMCGRSWFCVTSYVVDDV